MYTIFVVNIIDFVKLMHYSPDIPKMEVAIMTLQQIIESERIYLSPSDVSTILKCDPQSIRVQAHSDPSKLGFPIIVINRRIRIPREAFLRFLGVL